ncbi:MAG: HEAT repeat domain-containing protein [Myxococcota bacterium]
MSDADPSGAEERRQKVITLEQAPEDDARSAIMEALGDEDWRVRKEAVRVATVLSRRVPLAPELLSAIVQGENVGLRNAALEVWGLLGARATGALLDVLPTVIPQARKFVVEALGYAGGAGAVEALGQEVKSLDPNVSAAAIDALSRIGGEAASATLRERLKSPDAYHRLAALDALDRLRAPIPWDALQPLLVDPMVRRVAIRALGRSGESAAVEPLFEALADPSAHAVAEAAVAVAGLSASSEVAFDLALSRAPALGTATRQTLRELSDGPPEERRAVVLLLIMARDPGAVAAVTDLAANDILTPEIAEALSRWGLPAVEPMIARFREAVGKSQGIALELAADLLANVSSPPDGIAAALRRALREGLESRDAAVAGGAARGMLFWAEAGDAYALVRLAVRADEEVALTCGEVLTRLAADHSEAVQRALDGVMLDGPGGAVLTRVLGDLPGRDTLERIQTALSADDPGTRRSAIEALASVNAPSATEYIALALADEDIDVQVAAARALGTLSDLEANPAAIDQLLQVLQAEEPTVQAAAARALGRIGDPRAIHALRELLRNGSSGVAVEALRALRALSDPRLDELLIESLGHEDPEVVKQGLSAIGDSPKERKVERLEIGLSHAAWDVRRLSAELLGEAGDPSARGPLTAALAEEQDDLVVAAIEGALRKLGGRSNEG